MHPVPGRRSVSVSSTRRSPRQSRIGVSDARGLSGRASGSQRAGLGGGWRRLAVALAVLCLSLGGATATADPRQPAPGDAVVIEGGPGGCTLGFLFEGSDGAAYMSTAGHCLLGTDEVRRAWKPGAGPRAMSSDGPLGRVVFAENLPTPSGDDYFDFALIRIDRGVKPSSAVRASGTPGRINDSRSDGATFLRLYGQGTGVSVVAPARDLLAPSLKHADHVYAHGAAVMGDSGAPVVDSDGAAVGTMLGAGGIPFGIGLGGVEVGHDAALHRIGRLTPVLRHATAATGVRFTLSR
jgi:hypothetical protein